MVLIAIIIILLPYYQRLVTGDQPAPKQKTERVIKSDSTTQQESAQKEQVARKQLMEQQESAIEDKTRAISESILTIPVEQDVAERFIEIRSNKINVVLSNKGGGSLQKFILLNYEKNDSTLLNMIDNSIQNDLHFSFQSPNGDFIETSNYLFKSNKNFKLKTLDNGQVFEIKYTLAINDNELEKTYIFYDNRYHFDVVIKFSDPANMLLNRRYEFGWVNGLPSTEPHSGDDYNYSQAYVYMAEDLEGYSLSDPGKKETVTLSGSADWLAVRTKYFISSIMNRNVDVSEGIYFSGEGIQKESYVQRLYNYGYNAQYVNDNYGDTLRVYIGPLDHDELGYFENNIDELIMNNGWYERAFRFISLLVLPVLEFLYSIIPNYGIVIIIFSVLVKIIVYPLTKKSYSSMKEMQKIQPLMAEIREKYKDDAQRMNKEMMKSL